MSVNGLDTASTCTSTSAAKMKTAGYQFIGRYYGNYELTLTEAQNI